MIRVGSLISCFKSLISIACFHLVLHNCSLYIYNSKVKKDTLELSFHLLLPVSSILEFSSNVIYVTTSVILFPASTREN